MKVFYDSALAADIEFTLRQSIEPLNEIIEKFNSFPLNNIESKADIETLYQFGVVPLAHTKIKDRKFAGVDMEPDKILNVLGIAGALDMLQKSYAEYAHRGLGYIDCLDFKNGKLSLNEKGLKARIERDCYTHLTADQAKVYQQYESLCNDLTALIKKYDGTDKLSSLHPANFNRYFAFKNDNEKGASLAPQKHTFHKLIV